MKVLTDLIGVLFLVALGIPLSLLGGLVLSDFWEWFIQPVFAAPDMSYLQAVGVLYVAGVFKLGLQTMKLEGDYGDVNAGIGMTIGMAVGYLILWGTGAVWHLFI